MIVFSRISEFLNRMTLSSAPFLLALSGGPDSLLLFYALLDHRHKTGIPFHVAHIDHGWRPESCLESDILRLLSDQYEIPFHLIKLDPSKLSGNLEVACREERYRFFTYLNQQFKYEGVLTGHHQNDQAETIFKRIGEGAHWSTWKNLAAEIWFDDLRVLRPLLGTKKEEILFALKEIGAEAFKDSSNEDNRFLRARTRHVIFPWLDQIFGKNIQSNLLIIANEMEELDIYFHAKLAHLLDFSVAGPFGILLDLTEKLPLHLVEVKYLLRLFFKKYKIIISRSLIEQASLALLKGKTNRSFLSGGQKFWIDRKRIFIVNDFKAEDSWSLEIKEGVFIKGDWQISIQHKNGIIANNFLGWKQAWKGDMHVFLPLKVLVLSFCSNNHVDQISSIRIKKKWSNAKVPAFLYKFFPLILEDSAIYYEFLTENIQQKCVEKVEYWDLRINKL